MAIKAKQIQAEKTEAIANVKACFESANDFIFTEYRGLTVEQVTALRSQLREKNCTYKVVKNNFARIAFEELNKGDVSSYFVGPTAVALYAGEDEVNGVAKILFDFAKDAPALVIKGALVGGEIYDAAKLEAFSKLPGKKELISMLMSAMQATTSKLARTIKAVADKKASENPA